MSEQDGELPTHLLTMMTLLMRTKEEEAAVGEALQAGTKLLASPGHCALPLTKLPRLICENHLEEWTESQKSGEIVAVAVSE